MDFFFDIFLWILGKNGEKRKKPRKKPTKILGKTGLFVFFCLDNPIILHVFPNVPSSSIIVNNMVILKLSSTLTVDEQASFGCYKVANKTPKHGNQVIQNDLLIP